MYVLVLVIMKYTCMLTLLTHDTVSISFSSQLCYSMYASFILLQTSFLHLGVVKLIGRARKVKCGSMATKSFEPILGFQ